VGNRYRKRGWGPAVAYYAHNDGIRLLNSDLPVVYRRITVPASVPAGEVRIRVDKTGLAYVFSTSTTRAVMIAPDGFHVPWPSALTSQR
jgi:hypothetical protein